MKKLCFCIYYGYEVVLKDPIYSQLIEKEFCRDSCNNCETNYYKRLDLSRG